MTFLTVYHVMLWSNKTEPTDTSVWLDKEEQTWPLSVAWPGKAAAGAEAPEAEDTLLPLEGEEADTHSPSHREREQQPND